MNDPDLGVLTLRMMDGAVPPVTSQSTHTACHKIDGGMILVTTRITFVPDPLKPSDPEGPDVELDYDVDQEDWDDFGRGTE